MEGKTLVVEFSLGTQHDPEIKKLIQEITSLGIQTEMVASDCNVEECFNRLQKANKDPQYYSSLDLTENILEVLEGVMDSWRISKGMGYIE